MCIDFFLMLHQHLWNKCLNIEVPVFFKVISDCCSPPILSLLPINILARLYRHYTLILHTSALQSPPPPKLHPTLSLYYPEWMVIFPSENSPLAFLFVGLVLFGQKRGWGWGRGARSVYYILSLYGVIKLCNKKNDVLYLG